MPRVEPQPVLKVTKSERTRVAILNAALEFLWSHPFREMTVGSVTGPAGVSRSAFYQYFDDLHGLMAALLGSLREDILSAANPWLTDVGDPVALMNKSIAGLVHVCFERGPLVRAVSHAASTDEFLEEAWTHFLGRFDDAACARIEADQELGLVPDFDARPVAVALNRLDTYTFVEAFGGHPRNSPGPVQETLTRIWISTLYGAEWVGQRSSTLVRK